MKTNEPYDDKSQQAEERLADMLDAIEHAGRDSRRQQQLSSLIDQLAAEEAAVAHHRNRKRWTIAFSAAACIVLFVTTIVRLTGTTGSIPPIIPLVAKTNDSIPETKTIADTIVTPTLYKNAIPSITIAETISEEPLPRTEEDTIPTTDTLLRINEPEMLLTENPEDDEELQNQIASISAPITSVGNNENTSPNLQPEPQKKSRRLLRFLRPEASKMDGTMLAINIKL